MVALKLEYLFETGRAAERRGRCCRGSGARSVCLCDLPFDDVAAVAMRQSWTRDPFDRTIVAQAALRHTPSSQRTPPCAPTTIGRSGTAERARPLRQEVGDGDARRRRGQGCRASARRADLPRAVVPAEAARGVRHRLAVYLENPIDQVHDPVVG